MGVRRVGWVAVLVVGLLLMRWVGVGWVLLYAALIAALANAGRLAAVLRIRAAPRLRVALLLVAAHVVLAAVLWLPGWRANWGVPAAIGLTALAPAGQGLPALRAALARDAAAHNLGGELAADRAIAAADPTAGTYLRLGSDEVAAGQLGTAPTDLNTAFFLGAGSAGAWSALGQWYLRAAPGRPGYYFLAATDLGRAVAAAPGHTSYAAAEQKAQQSAARLYRTGSWAIQTR